MSIEFNIRKYREDDFFEVENIYNDSKPDEFSNECTSFEVPSLRDDYAMMSLFKQSQIYVCKLEKIVGFIGYKDNNVTWLFVSEDFRRMGVADALMSHCLPKIEGRCCLTVASSNVRAQRLYSKYGFVVEKKFSGKFQGKELGVTKMVKI